MPELKEKQKKSKEREKAGVYRGTRGITEVYNIMINSGAKEYLTFGGGWMCEKRMGILGYIIFIIMIIIVMYQVLRLIIGGTWELENIIIALLVAIITGLFTIFTKLAIMGERTRYMGKNIKRIGDSIRRLGNDFT